MSTAVALPTWDMTPYFPSLDSDEFQAALDDVRNELKDAAMRFDEHNIDGGASIAFSDDLKGVLERAINRMNSLGDQLELLGSYVYAFISTDANDELAQAKDSELRRLTIEFSKLGAHFTAWCGRLPLDELFESSEVAKNHEHALKRRATQAQKLMAPALEELAADLTETGSSAWGLLKDGYASLIEAEVQLPDGPQTLPISQIRNLASDPDQTKRKAAYDAELDAWKQNTRVCAAAMNSIKGEVGKLCARRGWESPLDEALFNAAIDRPTLDAMMGAARDSFPAFRRYFRAKAKQLGHSGGLPWYDLFAPVGDGGEWPYEKAVDYVVEKFGTYSDKLSEFARRADRERWMDVPPKAGKAGGAFCMGTRDDESRILLNFSPSFDDVTTLAHELGHGYHNTCLADRTYMQSDLPMTLAETASIFCETIIKKHAIRQADGDELLAILEASIQGAGQTVVDISSRFLFESEVFERRADRSLSATELNEAMLRAQEQTYGDGLNPDLRHPYMWAVKPHYYSTYSFYNFPYMFGLLFGLGLYAVYEGAEGDFVSRYDELLSSTGMADAATLGERFGIDIRDKAFWADSLAVVEGDIDRFCELVN